MENNRRQINIRLEEELLDFFVDYSRKNYKTVTGMLRQIISDLYREHQARVVVDENGKTVMKK